MSHRRDASLAAEWRATLRLLLLLCVPTFGIAAHVDLDARRDGDRCPVECACLGNVVDCSGLQLVATPVGLPPWTETLDVSANRLKENFTFALSGMVQLRSLKVDKNQLTRVPDFPSTVVLNHLMLVHNSIDNIDGVALHSLPELLSLDLSGNHLTALRKGSFLAPCRLTHLTLNANQIAVIENGSLDNLTSLEELRMNKNRLTHLKDVFTNLEQLRVLELNRNELRQIQGLRLKNLTNLEELRLKRNKIDTLDDGAFWPLKNLLVLQLDHNLLTAVKKGGLFGLQRLRKLGLSHNRIATIEAGAWEICREITEIDLSHNELTAIERGTFDFLEKLERIRMDQNKITYISDGSFNSAPNLRVLELNWNKISYTVEDVNGAFVPLGKLTRLGLAHNRIKSVNKNAFTGLVELTELDLTGNNITSIQENALASMPSLVQLKMNSASLVCDCGLQWLSVWLRNHMYTEAKVHCGYPHWLQGMSLADLHHANFTCDEYPKPRIVEEPASKMSIKGDNVTLTCRATSTANASLHFIWKHNNVELLGSNARTESSAVRGITEASSVLHLTNVTHADAGRYQCTVANTYGTTYSAKAKISVLIFPSFSKIPHDIRVTAGSTASLECSAEGQPAPQIAWQKDGGNDFPAARERRMHMMPTDDMLFIVNVKTADSGVYSCTAQNLAGLIVANATLTILDAPSFVKPMENKEIIAGASIVLECMASGSPRPKLAWRKNGSPLQATERHFFTADNQLLIIVDTTASDAGSYECEMSNSLGSVVGASHLTINPAPTSMVNEDDMLGLIIITVVCCAVGTSVVWVVIIYQTRRRLSAAQNVAGEVPAAGSQPKPAAPDAETHLYLDTSSQHSKDSGTGDSTNPSSDQLQLCLPEEIVTCGIGHEDDTATANGCDPLLRYTNHERHARSSDPSECAV